MRPVAHRFGGSHAQRDVITLTLVEAALRGGMRRRAEHHIAERLVPKPHNRWGLRLAARATTSSGGVQIALCVRPEATSS